MKKTLLIISLATVLLAACQSNSPLREAPQENDKSQKANSNSVVNINVVDTNNTTVSKSTASTGDINITIGQNGMSPTNLTAKANNTLAIYNGSEQEVNLYTTTDGEKPCTDVGATITLAAREKKVFNLKTAMNCHIMNQYNSNDQVILTVQ